MRTLRILHAADLHMDSAFESLVSRKAAQRRAEQRSLLTRLAALVRTEGVDLVLLSGDLFDSDSAYFETLDAMERFLAELTVPVIIAPGNHDYYSAVSPYARLKYAENVHIFKGTEMECTDFPALSARVCGGAFTDAAVGPVLSSFRCEREEGVWQLLCAHAEVGFAPVNEQALAQSGFDYAALGHIHKPSGLRRSGNTWYSWPGSPEGRGFDETGDRFVNLITLSDEGCSIKQCVIAMRRYEILRVDVTGQDALLAVHAALPDDTVRDVYRVILTGEVDRPLALDALRENLKELFFELQLRDETRLRRSVWERSGEDSLRGIFLAKLRAQYDTADEEGRVRIEQAARWGIAALDHMEEVVRHDPS